MILLTPEQAALVAGLYHDDELDLRGIDPRLIDAGTYAGRLVVPVRVLEDQYLVGDKRALLETAVQADIDPALVWPVREDE